MRDAFSLIELLSTIVIVAILAALIFSGLNIFLEKRGNIICVSNLKQIGVAVSLYAAEHDGCFPPSQSSYEDINALRHWFDYLMDGDVPHSNLGSLPNANKKNDPSTKTVYHCPMNPGRIGPLWSLPNYAYNRGVGYIYETDPNPDNWINIRVRIVNLTQPSKTVLVVDGAPRGGQGVPSPSVGPEMAIHHITRTYDWEESTGFDWHKGHANFLMADGHVEAIKKEEATERFNNKTLLWSGNNDRTTSAPEW